MASTSSSTAAPSTSQELHPLTITDTASTAHDPTTAHEAYDEFLDDLLGRLPDVNPLGDLDNEVHPMFQRKNFAKQIAEDPKPVWEFLPDATYTAMLPALRLASLLITQQSMSHVFDHIANGVVTEDEGGTQYLATGPWEGSKLGFDYIQAVFGFMSTRLFIEFPLQLTDNEGLPQHNTMAHNTRLLDDRKEISTYTTWLSLNGLHVLRMKDEYGQQIRRYILGCQNAISFHRCFLDYFEKGIQQDTVRGQLNALFSFVGTLVHEVTHAFGGHVENFFSRPSMELTHSGVEHRWSLDDPIRELGWAHNAWFAQGAWLVGAEHFHKLGSTGTIFPIDVLVHALLFVPLSKPNTVCIARSPSGSNHVLRAEDVRKWFLKSTWHDIETGKDSHAKIMGLSKCTELSINSTHLVALARGKVVARLDVQTMQDKGWFKGWFQRSDHLGEGYWAATSSQDFSPSTK